MDISETRIDALHVYAISSGPAPIPRDQVPPVVYQLFDQLRDRLADIDIAISGRAIAWYERVTGEFGEHSQRAWVGYVAGADEIGGEISPVVLDGAEHVAIGTHYGPMATIRQSWNELFDWVHEHGGHSAGYAREVHLRAWPEPEENWVTRLELPFTTE
ncbi:hypothetical protein GCM10022288_15450 [Gryllotalpicola kribbensis]|jgi:effector-binding domain-containing protein|uniref:GyrI-like small molecule binding domain-containing protein n=1 Tax=Gryllotalpicola kribbensis TaxID=993084 RepID=A0ABP8AS74_9MICO